MGVYRDGRGGAQRDAYVGGNPVLGVDPAGLLSYLLSRPLAGNLGAVATHNFIVTNADYIGDPGASVYSYGMNAAGNVGRVNNATEGFSAGTHNTDNAVWRSMSIEGNNVTLINAADVVVETYANHLIENQDYAAIAGLFGANSNSAAQAIANRAAGVPVPTPGGWRLSPGAGSWDEIQFKP